MPGRVRWAVSMVPSTELPSTRTIWSTSGRFGRTTSRFRASLRAGITMVTVGLALRAIGGTPSVLAGVGQHSRWATAVIRSVPP